MYRLSKYWNRIAYFLIHTGQRMIWDYTKRNKDLKSDDNVTSDTAEAIFCDR